MPGSHDGFADRYGRSVVHDASTPRRQSIRQFGRRRVVVAQVHRDDVGGVRDRTGLAQRGEGARERRQIVVPGTEIGARAEGLLQEHRIEAGIPDRLQRRPRQRPGVGGPQHAVAVRTGDVVEHAVPVAEHPMRGREDPDRVAVQHDSVAGDDRDEPHRIVRPHPVAAQVERIGRADHVEWAVAAHPRAEQQRRRIQVIGVGVREQEVSHVGQRASGAHGGAGDVRPAVEQDRVVDQARGLPADLAALGGDVARRAHAEGVGPPVGTAGAQQYDLDGPTPSVRVSAAPAPGPPADPPDPRGPPTGARRRRTGRSRHAPPAPSRGAWWWPDG